MNRSDSDDALALEGILNMLERLLPEMCSSMVNSPAGNKFNQENWQDYLDRRLR